MPISPKSAYQSALAALEKQFPGQGFALTALNIGADPKESLVFRAKCKGVKQSYICKVGEPENWVRNKLKSSFKLQKRAFKTMTGDIFKVPKAIAWDDANVCFLQEDAKGQSFSEVIEDADEAERRRFLHLMGGWIRAYHDQSLSYESFKASKYAETLSEIAFPPIKQAAKHALRLAEKADGKRNAVAVVHGDCHSGQFTFRGNGAIYGFDFSSEAADIVLRDIYHLGLHIALRKKKILNMASAEVLNEIRVGYGDVSIDIEVEDFWALAARIFAVNAQIQKGAEVNSARIQTMIGEIDALL